MKETREQLNSLIGTFADPAQARKMADEIEQAESILAAADTPRPRPELLEDIKFLMIRRQRTLHQKRFLIRTALSGAAACLLISLSFFVYMKTVGSIGQDSPVALNNWNSLISASDTTVEQVSNELEKISDQLYTARSSLWESPEEEFGLDEFENLQLLQEKDFWKG